MSETAAASERGAGADWLAFTPRDTVFVRDGRSFDAANDAFAQTVRPAPTTVAGAVGAAFGENPLEVRGPVLARRSGAGWSPYFPVPADLVVTEDRARRVYRLRPREGFPRDGRRTGRDGVGRDGDKQLQMLLPPAHAEPVQPVGGDPPGRLLMPAAVLAQYLAGGFAGERGTPVGSLRLAEPLLPEQRVGLARDGRRAREGLQLLAKRCSIGTGTEL